MPMPGGTAKVCVICGEDCSDRPRTKDPKGRYYCQWCYERKSQPWNALGDAADSTHPKSVAPMINDDSSPYRKKQEQVVAPPIAAPPVSARSSMTHFACPSCGKTMHQGDAVCISCGHSLHATYRHRPPPPPKPAFDRRAPWLLWPVYLVMWPSAFFRNFAVASPVLFTAVAGWIYGMAATSDRLDTRMFISQMQHKASSLPDNWAFYWGFICSGGAVSALFMALVGAWWYRVRLGWCGAKGADWSLVRRVYFFSGLVVAVPMLAIKAISTALYASPSLAAAADFEWLDLLPVIGIFWALFISFAGARTVFAAGRFRAAFWFIAFPGVFYMLALLAMFGFGAFMAMAAADVRHPEIFHSQSMTFAYPGNWVTSEESDESGAAMSALIRPLWHDAHITIDVYETELDVNGELDATLEQWRIDAPRFTVGTPFNQWGPYNGAGRNAIALIDGEPYSVRIFVAELSDGRMFEVTEACLMSQEKAVKPGFDLIQTSLQGPPQVK